jgi:3',5'-cyclic AMP phosphodiesterase CpdA
LKLAWLTDIHLNFLDAEPRRWFLESIRDQGDALVISGDIGESPDVVDLLCEMDRIVQRPIYFVLGNHDFYRGSIAQTRAAVIELTRALPSLVYLSAGGVVELTATTALVGHDGWADGRLGDFDGSDVVLNDYLLIRELFHWNDRLELDKGRLRAALQALGDEAAAHFRRVLSVAAAKYPRVIAATHVPPFREAAWHEGRPSDDDYLPHFACQAVGEVLREVLAAHPRCQALVLCGHTHGGGQCQVLDNLRVLTGAATYGAPAIVQVLEVA